MSLVLPLLDLQSNTHGEMPLSDAIFGLTPDVGLLHMIVRWQSWRSGRAQVTKGRGDIRASGCKIGRQKGGGRARHGSRTANIFRGGAQAHGPSGERRPLKLNKKVKSLALRQALSEIYGRGDLILLKDTQISTNKTSILSSLLDKLALGRILIIDTEMTSNFFRSVANIRRVSALPIEAINVYDILLHKKLILTKSALKSIERRFASLTLLPDSSPLQDASSVSTLSVSLSEASS